MPTYTYYCSRCDKKFELFAYFNDYCPTPQCTICNKHIAERSYSDDLIDIACSVRKNSSELKTIGDIANRNRDSMSDDHKAELYHKHNEYKDASDNLNLPKGMSKIQKPKKKIKWT